MAKLDIYIYNKMQYYNTTDMNKVLISGAINQEYALLSPPACS